MEKVLYEYFGYTEFKPIQKEIIEEVLKGNNCIAVLPTGYGKSLIFQMLSILKEGITIVISPLIALMEDQKKNLNKHNINNEIINSNMSFEQIRNAYKRIERNDTKLIYISPERLLNKSFQEFISKQNVSLLVVDEAHTILWGESFREAFLQIGNFIDKLKPNINILAVTATATNQTIAKIKPALKTDNWYLFKESVVNKRIYYGVKHNVNKLKYLKNYLSLYSKDKILIYCLTRRTVEYLHRKLAELGIIATFYHGGLSSEIKQENQRVFTEGLIKIMICTNAFGMGIDIPDIRHIIHYEFPASIEDLVQQAGRASRDGGNADEVILFNFNDIKIVNYLHNELKPTVKKIEQKKLDEVIKYCLTKQCRHQYIAKYFNEKIKKCKCSCDNCKH